MPNRPGRGRPLGAPNSESPSPVGRVPYAALREDDAELVFAAADRSGSWWSHIEISLLPLTEIYGLPAERIEIHRFSLEPWYDSPHGEEPGSRKEEMHGHL